MTQFYTMKTKLWQVIDKASRTMNLYDSVHKIHHTEPKYQAVAKRCQAAHDLLAAIEARPSDVVSALAENMHLAKIALQ